VRSMYIWTVYPGLYIYMDCIHGKWTVYMVSFWFHSGFILVSYMDCIHGFILVSFMYIWTVYRIYNTKRACLLFPVSSMYIWTVSCELYVYLCISGHDQGLMQPAVPIR
jgi:hypothetical protein